MTSFNLQHMGQISFHCCPFNPPELLNPRHIMAHFVLFVCAASALLSLLQYFISAWKTGISALISTVAYVLSVWNS